MLAEEEKTSKSAILIPQSRDLNRSPVVDSKHDFIALALLIRLYLVKERKKVRRDINLLFSQLNTRENACLSDVCNTFILMDYTYYSLACQSDLYSSLR